MTQTIVAVTGADGFIGSHLTELLVDRGHHVRAMVQYNSLGSWGWLDAADRHVLEQVTVVPGDIRDPASVLSLLTGAETVYHLAALIAIPYSYQAPRSYLETNVLGTLHVLEAVRELGTPRLVHTSTSETYGTARTVPISEEHPLHGQSPYAASKIAADKLAESYHASFGVPVVTVRPFNTFGPRQSARAVIPAVISQIAAARSSVRLGLLTPTRDFMFVKDTAAAFAAAGNAPADAVIGREFNAGTGAEISIGDLAAQIARLMGRDIEIEGDPARMRPAASEVMRLVCDAAQLQQRTGWRPRHTLEQGLELTIEWFTDPANLARYRPGRYTI